MTVPPDIVQRMVALRRDLHQHPELSWKEHRTARQIASHLEALNIAFRPIAGSGLVADLPGDQDGCIALRADTDALPIHEETGLPFASSHPGVMHACGHDGHASMLLGAGALLNDRTNRPSVRLLWQPAEETGAGAVAMIAEGALDGVDCIFGGHLDRDYEPGTLIVTDGPVNASADTFAVRIVGQSGHGARPHQAIDTIVIGSHLVTALQTIVSREIDPARPGVISVGSFHSGSAPNVIAGEAVLEGTIRSLDAETRQHLREAVPRIAAAIGQLHGAQVTTTFLHGTPALINTPTWAGVARRAASSIVGAERVGTLSTSNMGGEDFAYYLEKVPGAYIRYGALVKGREAYPAHSSRWDFHEDALSVGAAWMVEVVHHAARTLEAIGPQT